MIITVNFDDHTPFSPEKIDYRLVSVDRFNALICTK